MLEKPQNIGDFERVILVGLEFTDGREVAEEYLNELAALVTTTGALVCARFIQHFSRSHKATLLGSGKLLEIKEYIVSERIDCVIFDEELSGSQWSNIYKILQCKIVDRTGLILDIFAKHARSAQAKAQVALAQYQYLLPRLKGFWSHLERQGGGIGTRGPGETEIETDRRIVQAKINGLKKQLSQIEKQAYIQRKDRGKFIRVAITGYTNVGKSTLMNKLSKSSVVVDNKLFVTLEDTTRKVVWQHTPFLLSDTVGFIRKLPHNLVQSFKSTLAEVAECDILLHVIDISDIQCKEHIQVVKSTLDSIGVKDKPTIYVFNKIDLYRNKNFDQYTEQSVIDYMLAELALNWQQDLLSNCVFISAEREDLQELKQLLLHQIRTMYKEKYPHQIQYFY